MAFGNHKVEIVVGVKDLASRALSGISKEVSNMSKDMSKMGSTFGALNRTLDSTISKLDRAANSMYKFNMYTSSIQRNLGNIATAGAAIGGAVAYQGVNNALQFDYKTHIMQSRMEVGSNSRQQIEDYILKDLNLKVGFNPTQLADMGIILGQGGISNTNDMKSALKTTSYFAEAVDAAPEQAAEMIISASKGFNISMANSTQITDKLTVALNKSLLHVEEMPHAIGELAGRANMMGQSLDSSLVALMTMRDQGLSAAQGAQDFLHGLRQASRIGNDDVMYARTQSYFDSLGIGGGIFDQSTRKLKEFPELIADVEKAMVINGFVNPKYNIKNMDQYQDYLSANGGQAPQDFWDSMMAAPLITKIFGAAGQAPILMGMQSKYETVDDEGNKTGEVLYGSEALKAMYNDVKNSNGAVDKTHDIVADSAQFQLQILSGAWQATQIKMLDGILPIIKTSAEELTGWLTPGGLNDKVKPGGGPAEQLDPPKTGLERFQEAIDKAAENFRNDGNVGTANFVDSVGSGIVNGVKIGGTMPPMFKQIIDAFNENFVDADWGSNAIEFPIHIVKNGIAFINDLLKANEEFQAAVSKLPENLQDPAKLVETLIKGGIVLLVTGAVVKVIELGVRGVSAALTGAKMATDLTTTIVNFIKGALGGGDSNNNPAKDLMKNMNINANIVNVYGKSIVGGGDLPVGGAPDDGKTNNKNTKTTPKVPNGKWRNILSTGTGVVGGIIAGDITSGALGGPSITKSIIEQTLDPKTDAKIDKMHSIITNPSTFTGPKEVGESEIVSAVEGNIWAKLKDFLTPKPVEPPKPAVDLSPWLKPDKMPQNQVGQQTTAEITKQLQNFASTAAEGSNILNSGITSGFTTANSTIVNGFNTANSKLQNLKLNNSIMVQMPPANVVISGNVKEHISNVSVSSVSKAQQSNGIDTSNMDLTTQRTLNARRLGW